MGEHACPQGPECRIGGYSALGGQVVALDPPTPGCTRQRSLGPGKQVDQQHVVHSGAGRGQARLNPRDVEQPGAVALAEAQHGHRLLARTLDMKARIVHFTQHGHDRSVGPDRCEATHQCRPNAAAATVGSLRQIVELAHTRSVLGVQGGADRNLVIDGDDRTPDMIDGMVTYTVDDNHEIDVCRSLGTDRLTHFSRIHHSGGAACGTIHQAAMAVMSGAATYCLVYRAFNERSETRFGVGVQERAPLPTPMEVDFGWSSPFGLLTPASWVAMFAQRYMHEYGATTEDFGRVAVACRRRRPRCGRRPHLAQCHTNHAQQCHERPQRGDLVLVRRRKLQYHQVMRSCQCFLQTGL